MKQLKVYNRKAAVEYARTWALDRNPKYKDYELWGGDCTNFISQCIHAGNIPFDHQGRDVFGRYILRNNNENTDNHGIYAVEAEYNELEEGDIIQLIYEGRAFHTMIVSQVILDDRGYLLDYLVCQHTYDLIDYPLSQKIGERRYIKILGYYN